MRPIRIIPKLDIKNGQLIKGINLEGLRILGDPYLFAKEYYENNADEIFYLDNVATLYGTNNLCKFVTKTVKNIFIPIMVGGGIRTIEDIDMMLQSGADRVCINSAAINNIKIINNSAKIYGSSTICSLVECVKIDNKYIISKSNGRDLVSISPTTWVKRLENSGSGEIIFTCVQNEGLKKGFDIKIIEKISKEVSIPVIAHGGAGTFKDVYDVIKQTNISGVSIASLFHYDILPKFKFHKRKIGNYHYLNQLTKSNLKSINNLYRLKKYLKSKKINVRL